MKYSEEKINEIEKNIIDGMNAEDDAWAEIEQLSESITTKLIENGKTREKLYGTEYIFNIDSDKSEKRITVMCTDPIKLELANGHYVPCLANGEWDESYTYEENVFAVVKAIVSSKAGKIQVEELDD